MLNPSTADGRADDATIRRCRGLLTGKRAGGRAGGLRFGAFVVVNLFTARATRPEGLRDLVQRGGSGNDVGQDRADRAIVRAGRLAVRTGGVVVAAWGRPRWGFVRARAAVVDGLLRGTGASVRCLGVTRGGWPRHPLYLPGSARLRAWDGPDGGW